jgi:hypothetical protein
VCGDISACIHNGQFTQVLCDNCEAECVVVAGSWFCWACVWSKRALNGEVKRDESR